MAFNENLTIEVYELYAGLSSQKPETIKQMGIDYGQLAEALFGGAGDSVIESNEETYKYLLNDYVAAFASNLYSKGTFDDIEKTYPNLGRILNSSSEDYVALIKYDRLSIISAIESIPTCEEVVKSLDFFGVPTVDDSQLSDDEKAQIEAETNTNFEGLDNINDDIEGIIEEATKELNEEQENQPEEPEEPDIDSFNEKLTDSEVKGYTDLYGAKLDSAINGILLAFDRLYKSGYEVCTPSGILTNTGTLRTYTDGHIGYDGDIASDIDIYDIIVKALGGKFKYFTDYNSEIDVNDLLNTQKEVIITDIHLQALYGHIKPWKNSKSLRVCATNSNVEHDGIKIRKWTDLRRVLRDRIKKLFLEAYKINGVGYDTAKNNNVYNDYKDLVDKINRKLSRQLKNVVIVSERKPKVNTRIRMCSDDVLNLELLQKELIAGLNIGTARNTNVEIGSSADGVYEINIIYNDKAFKTDALFAWQVLDTLEEQGIRPSWDNVVLGKNADDGTILTYNFKNREFPIFDLYAGSRSGKGVMTLNLLASALADNCKVMYVDCKPEIAITLGDIAWKNGNDAFVFAGPDTNLNQPLEDRPGNNCVRTLNRFYDLENLPEGLFGKNDTDENTNGDVETRKRRFAQVVHYLKCMEVLLHMVRERMDKCSNDDWVVAVFDECENFAASERMVISDFERTYERRKKTKVVGDDGKEKKINETTDPVCCFINDFNDWRNELVSRFESGVTAGFGKANISLIFVWQSSRFPGKFTGFSTIAKMVDKGRNKAIKILGKGAIISEGSNDFGNNTVVNKLAWYDERFKGEVGGYFAIGSNIQGNMHVFRPFTIYTDANNKELAVSNAKTIGLTEEDLYGVSIDPNTGQMYPEVGFEGYTNKLLGRFGLTAGQQLKVGWDYVNNFMQQKGLPGTCEYIYDVHNFGIEGSNRMSPRTQSSGFGNIAGFNQDSIGDFMNAVDEGDAIDFGDEPIGVNNIGNTENGVQQGNPQKINVDNGINVSDALWSQGRRQEIQPEEEFNWKNYENLNVSVDENGRIKEFDSKPLEDDHTDSQQFGVIPGGRGGVTFRTSGKAANVLKLDPENAIMVEVNGYKSPANTNRFLSFARGADYELRSRWKYILDTVERGQDARTISKIAITSDSLIFNNRAIAAVGLMGGADGVEVRDIVSFSELAKRFKNLRQLTIDTEIYEAAAMELNNNPEENLFRMFSKLQRIIMYKPGYNEPPLICSRESLNDERMRREMETRHARSAQKQAIDTICAANNPNRRKFNGLDLARVNKTCSNLVGGSWATCKKSFDNDHYISGTLKFCVATLLSVPYGISKMIGLSRSFARR